MTLILSWKKFRQAGRDHSSNHFKFWQPQTSINDSTNYSSPTAVPTNRFSEVLLPFLETTNQWTMVLLTVDHHRNLALMLSRRSDQQPQILQNFLSFLNLIRETTLLWETHPLRNAPFEKHSVSLPSWRNTPLFMKNSSCLFVVYVNELSDAESKDTASPVAVKTPAPSGDMDDYANLFHLSIIK